MNAIDSINKKIEDFIADSNVTDVIIHGNKKVFVNGEGGFSERDGLDCSDSDLEDWIKALVEKRGRLFDPGKDLLIDISLESGHRVNVVRAPVSPVAPIICIRSLTRSFSIDDLIRLGMISEGAADFIKACVLEKFNIFIFGGTGSGKTTFLNTLANLIPLDERIVSIEDTLEIRIPHANWSRLEAFEERASDGKVNMRNLVINSLRMLPQRLIIGECRGPEVYDMIQAANTGHKGMMTTLHANSSREALTRLENLCLLVSNLNNMKPIRSLLTGAVDILVHIVNKKGKRYVNEIAQVTGMEGDIISLGSVFKYNEMTNELKPTGFIPTFWHEVLKKYSAFENIFR
jgi:pilus assembly protein CpaF